MKPAKNKIEKFEDLIVWQKALKVCKKTYVLSSGGPWARDFTLKDQVRKASISVISNISEGFGRHGKQDFRHFLSMANGSANEVRAQLHLARELGYVTSSEITDLIDLCSEVSRMIKGLRNSV